MSEDDIIGYALEPPHFRNIQRVMDRLFDERTFATGERRDLANTMQANLSGVVELTTDMAEAEAEVIILRRILDQVELTCGQGNMNCVGSRRIKDLLKTRPHAKERVPTSGNR